MCVLPVYGIPAPPWRDLQRHYNQSLKPVDQRAARLQGVHHELLTKLSSAGCPKKGTQYILTLDEWVTPSHIPKESAMERDGTGTTHCRCVAV